MKCDKRKFWLENVNSLVCDTRLIPCDNMCLEEQMNVLTRLVIIIFVILLLLNFKQSFIFLLISLIFIIILYYIQKNKMQVKENYSPKYKKNGVSQVVEALKKYEEMTHPSSTVNRFCHDGKNIPPNQNYVSNNQKLAEGASPITKIPPVVVAPPAAFDYWAETSVTVPNIINDMPFIDKYNSGYIVSNCCDNIKQGYKYNLKDSQKDIETEYESIYGEKLPYIKEGYESNGHSRLQKYDESILKDVGLIPRREIDKFITAEPPQLYPYYNDVKNVKNRITPGDVNTTCGYDSEQMQYNLPSNYSVGQCDKNQVMDEYNKNLFTDIITPGVYSYQQVIEPISSNIGISFNQQFEPVTCKKNNKGELTYTTHDPRQFEGEPLPYENFDSPSESNVYDPRYEGYGTNYRAYVDEQLGQPRFFYDDVDAIRRPNYITRNKLDTFRFAPTYGPMVPNEDIKGLNATIRELADQQFLEDTLKQRTELQQRLMSKRNKEMWQLKVKPLSRCLKK